MSNRTLAEICDVNSKVTESVTDKWSKHNNLFTTYLESLKASAKVVDWYSKQYKDIPTKCFFIVLNKCNKELKKEVWEFWKSIATECGLSFIDICDVGDFGYPYTAYDIEDLKSTERIVDYGPV